MLLPRLALLALALTLPGCVSLPGAEDEPGSADAPDDWAANVLSWPEDHDHADAAQHEGLTTPNFEILGHDPLLSPHYGGTTPAGYLCGDAKPTADGRRLAVIESRSEVGFTIADVTDPAQPKWLGEFVMPRTYVYDVAMVPDGKHVVITTSDAQLGLPSLPPVAATASLAPPAIEWRSACASAPVLLAQPDPIPRPASIILVSIEDPANPAIVDQRPLAGMGHSAYSTELDGRTWILVSATNVPGTDTFSFYELADTPLGTKLNLLSTYAPGVANDQLSTEAGGHDDGVIAKHPITGQTLAWLVNRRDLTLLDLADPRLPQVVGTWSDWTYERRGFSANLHSIVPLDVVWGEKHYTVIGPEWTGKPEAYPSGIVYVLDTTDPADIRSVAGWTLPAEPAWTDYLHFSTHYLGVVDRTLFVSMYHAGVWAIDLTPVETATEFVSLPSIGVFMPNRVSPAPPETPVRWTPTLEEVLPMPDGTLVTFDSNSGLYAFRFDATRPAQAPTPWPIETPPR